MEVSSTASPPEMMWLQPRALEQEEIVRLAQAQAYAARVTQEQGQTEREASDITSSVPNGSVDEKSVTEPEDQPTKNEDANA